MIAVLIANQSNLQSLFTLIVNGFMQRHVGDCCLWISRIVNSHSYMVVFAVGPHCLFHWSVNRVTSIGYR